MTTLSVEALPLPNIDEPIEARFRRLRSAWHSATSHLSSMTAASKDANYRRIIDLGPDVVPLLLRDLEQNETHWFIALRELTEANPIPSSAAGNIPRMIEAWLQWAKEHGYR